MIKKIEMLLPRYKVVIEEYECIINGKKVVINESDIDEIIRIIRNWKYEYISNFIEDIYSIRIIAEKEYLYKFYNAFPSDFNLLIDYLGVLYDRG